MKNKLISIFQIIFPLIIGGIVALIINNYIDYNYLNKPPLAPPKILFPIAWSIIYLLMGISYYLYRKNNNNKLTITIYYLQLFINALWSIIFFVFKLRLLAIIWIIILLITIIILLKQFKKENITSYYLNIPYLLWTIFATYLTIGIYLLN